MEKEAERFSNLGSKKGFIKVLMQGRASQDPTSSRLSQIKAIAREQQIDFRQPGDVLSPFAFPAGDSCVFAPVMELSCSPACSHSSLFLHHHLLTAPGAGHAAASQPSTFPGQGGHIPCMPKGIFCPQYSHWHREISNPCCCCCCCCLGKFSPSKTLVNEVAVERWGHISNPNSAFLCSARRNPKKQQLGCGRAAPRFFRVWVQNYHGQDKLH